MNKYKVLREMFGDKNYKKGDIREANANDVAHLVDCGALVLHADSVQANHLVEKNANNYVKKNK